MQPACLCAGRLLELDSVARLIAHTNTTLVKYRYVVCVVEVVKVWCCNVSSHLMNKKYCRFFSIPSITTQECNMYKLGFCIYGPICRYRHTFLSTSPPDPATVDAAKPREFRSFQQVGDCTGVYVLKCTICGTQCCCICSSYYIWVFLTTHRRSSMSDPAGDTRATVIMGAARTWCCIAMQDCQMQMCWLLWVSSGCSMVFSPRIFEPRIDDVFCVMCVMIL